MSYPPNFNSAAFDAQMADGVTSDEMLEGESLLKKTALLLSDVRRYVDGLYVDDAKSLRLRFEDSEAFLLETIQEAYGFYKQRLED
jgi:hypothetical protein